MRLIYLCVFYVFLLLMACGPSQEEIAARQQIVADSLRTIREDSTAKAEQIERERIHQEKIEVGKSIKKNKLTKILSELNTQLQNEKRELSRINEFEFGRARSTKDRQLSDQKEKINDIESFITKVEKELAMTSLFNSFEFQQTPNGTIEHIFTSAQNNELGKMRHLLDPYGEYDSEAMDICLVEMLPSEGQEKWREAFKNGRVMGEPEMNGDKAIIEIAYGPSSNRLAKINLVQRMDKWYILSL